MSPDTENSSFSRAETRSFTSRTWPAPVWVASWLIALSLPPLYWLVSGESERALEAIGLAVAAGFLSYLPMFLHDRRARRGL